MFNKPPEEWSFKEVITWANGYFLIQLGEGSKVRDIIYQIVEYATRSAYARGKQDGALEIKNLTKFVDNRNKR